VSSKPKRGVDRLFPIRFGVNLCGRNFGVAQNRLGRFNAGIGAKSSCRRVS
jgi:hypothetical protein